MNVMFITQAENQKRRNPMKSELSTILDAAKGIRESYKLYGVSDYVKQYDSMLLGNMLDLIEALDEYDNVVENDEWHED